MDLREIVRVLWKWSWLIALATVVAAFFSWLAARDQPVMYQTSTTLMIGQAIAEADPTWSEINTSERLAQTYSDLIRREPILKQTAQALGFESWRQIKSQISVYLVPGTQLMEIRITDSDPQRAKLIANEIARQLIATVSQSRPQENNREFIEAQAASFPAKIEAAQQEIQKLEAELAEAFSAQRIQELQERIGTLESQIGTWQTTFAQYQILLGEGGVNVLTVIEEAAVPTEPIQARWMIQVLLTAAIGGVLAVGTAFVLEYFDDSVQSAQDVSEATGLATLSTIGHIPGDSEPEKLIAVQDPMSLMAEGYRMVRTNLQFSSPDRPLRSLLVTSPSQFEGKSTTVANLGVVMAQAGRPVILVDADLRRSSLHKFFDLANEAGLTDALLQEEPALDGWLQETEIDNLRVLTSGPLPYNPSELLSSQKMQRFVRDLEQAADMVIFDSPPTLPVTDAVVLAAQTDGILLIADAGRTRLGAIHQAMENLQRAGGNILGAVLNKLSSRSADYYQYRYDNQRERRRFKLPGKR